MSVLTPTKVVNLHHVSFNKLTMCYCGRPPGAPRVGGVVALPEPPAYGCLGNPFEVREWGEEALWLYETYFTLRVADDRAFRVYVEAQEGMALACWCVGRDGRGPCHCWVIARYLDAYRARRRAESEAARAARAAREGEEIIF